MGAKVKKLCFFATHPPLKFNIETKIHEKFLVEHEKHSRLKMMR